MVEAVRTTASTFEIWAIVVVAVFVLAVWLVGISVADNIQARESRRWWQRVHGPDAALGAPERTGDFRRDAAEADWRTEAPTRPDLPAQEAPTGRHAMPAQRTGDADRAERSLAGPDAGRADDDPESTGCA